MAYELSINKKILSVVCELREIEYYNYKGKFNIIMIDKIPRGVLPFSDLVGSRFRDEDPLPRKIKLFKISLAEVRSSRKVSP